jgi:hypothetical protein
MKKGDSKAEVFLKILEPLVCCTPHFLTCGGNALEAGYYTIIEKAAIDLLGHR